MAGELTGKVAIVTGAGSLGGIGAATVKRLTEMGASVWATDVNGEGAAEVASTLGAVGRTLDISDRTQIDACVAEVLHTHGRLDILVNNAGTTRGAKPFLEITSDDWDVSLAVNLKGTADLCQAALPALLDTGDGVIVNISSIAGIGGEPGFGAYCATKHAMVGLTKTIAAEFGRQGLRCNAVCPGYISTDMHLGVTQRLADEEGIDLEDMKAKRYARVALGRAGTPAEIADTVAYLCGPGGAYVSGITLPVGGGVPYGL
ncbi:MAG: SDR family NAD(P)-dependent oxidoreductase [Pseudomonadota bacterium]